MSSILDLDALGVVASLIKQAQQPEYREFIERMGEEVVKGFMNLNKAGAPAEEPKAKKEESPFIDPRIIEARAEAQAAKLEAASAQRQLTAAGRENQILRARNDVLTRRLQFEQSVRRGVQEGFERIRYSLSLPIPAGLE